MADLPTWCECGIRTDDGIVANYPDGSTWLGHVDDLPTGPADDGNTIANVWFSCRDCGEGIDLVADDDDA